MFKKIFRNWPEKAFGELSTTSLCSFLPGECRGTHESSSSAQQVLKHFQISKYQKPKTPKFSKFQNFQKMSAVFAKAPIHLRRCHTPHVFFLLDWDLQGYRNENGRTQSRDALLTRFKVQPQSKNTPDLQTRKS